MAPFGVCCGFMCFVALQFYVFCRAGGVGQQHQVLGRGCIPRPVTRGRGADARGWMNQRREPTLSDLIYTLNAVTNHSQGKSSQYS